MAECERHAELLMRHFEGQLAPEEALVLERHLEGCAACGEDYDLLAETFAVLPEPGVMAVPGPARDAVIVYAHEATRTPAATGPAWLALASGAGAGALALTGALAIDARGGFRELGGGLETGLIGGFVFIAMALGAAATAWSTEAGRTSSLGALSALAGYVLLAAALPINQSVNVCGRAVFGELLSLYQVCSTYVMVTAGYAAVPLLILVSIWAGGRSTGQWRLVSVLFTLAALPLLLLQAGFDAWLVPVSALVGLGAGAACGIWGGRCAHSCYCSLAQTG